MLKWEWQSVWVRCDQEVYFIPWAVSTLSLFLRIPSGIRQCLCLNSLRQCNHMDCLQETFRLEAGGHLFCKCRITLALLGI